VEAGAQPDPRWRWHPHRRGCQSATSAWAVGCTGGNTLILRWNGTVWKRVPSPNPSPDHAQCLAGVSAASASDAWAVGYTDGGGKTLIVRWNGIAWK